MVMIQTILLLVTGLLAALAVPSGAQIDERKLVDLTYSFDERTIFWPGNKPFQWEKETWGVTPGGYWYASGGFAMSEHGGTHIDAPIHFGKNKQTLDEIPIYRLVGPAVVVDVRDAVAKDRDYRLRVEDLKNWEARYGPIPMGAIILLRSGWGRYWPDKSRYLGSDTPGDAATLHFPGFSQEAAEFLVQERKIDGVGIDTASIDHGPSQNFIVHQILNGANVYVLENVANVDRLPASGATIIALPMKIKGGSGGPVRIIALLP
jgi:kynurenine formamidase